MPYKEEELASKIAAFWQRKELQYPSLNDPFKPSKIRRSLSITTRRVLGSHRI